MLDVAGERKQDSLGVLTSQEKLRVGVDINVQSNAASSLQTVDVVAETKVFWGISLSKT